MSTAEIVVRQAQPGDAAAVRDYLAELVAEKLPVLVLFERPPTVEAEERHLRRCLEMANCLFLVALHGDRVVGQLELVGGWQARRAHSAALAMSVARAWRGRGVGSALLAEMLAWVEGQSLVSRVELEVLANNPGAQRLYERLGFRVEGRRVAAVLVGGEAVDAVFMARLWPGERGSTPSAKA